MSKGDVQFRIIGEDKARPAFLRAARAADEAARRLRETMERLEQLPPDAPASS